MRQQLVKPQVRLQQVPLVMKTSTREASCHLCGQTVDDDRDITAKMTPGGLRFYCGAHI